MSDDEEENNNRLILFLFLDSVAISETSSATLPQSSTLTQEEGTVVTNALPGGGFSAPDLNNPPTFLQNFQGTGDVKFHQGGCHKEDGISDDGCASLTASGNPAGKRDLGSMASIFQMLNSLSTGARSRYTVQFYYFVASGRSQACTVSASLGNTQFYSSSLSSSGGASVLWNYVLTTVVADSASAVFSISMSCTGNGTSMILVDSIFISNQVTPQTIGDVKLDFGTPAVDPVNTSKAPVTTDRPRTASLLSTAATESLDTVTEEPIHPSSEVFSTDIDQTTEPVTPAGPGTSVTPVTSGTPGTPAPTRDAASPSETSCLPMCIPKRDAFERDWACDVLGIYSGPTYTYIPDCNSSALVNGECRFTDVLIRRSEIQTLDSTAPNQGFWNEQRCFRCNDCSLPPLFNPPTITHSQAELSFPTTTMTPVDSQPTTLATRTSQQPETTTTPAEVCIFNRGQSCTMAPGKLEAGTQWKESREDYHYQDTLEQCAAICQAMKNCESAGYWQTENRYLFTAKKITESYFTINNDRSFEHVTWTHKSCCACPSCQATPAPITRDITCSYEQGDVCQRVTSNKDGALCNYQGFWEMAWMESLERYPDQSSPAKCAAICRTREDCRGSGYKDSRCMFSPFVLESQKFRAWPDHSRDGVWDDISCFQCPHCA
ncbi:hypothetical protein EDB82DRAFT_554888 [Fusarium venenatum]|uniref:uncharacterized protein n=1 Tax=Fusarium venenatum TaxID=56646 RepID=UPI001D28BA17|nr:hypothetical protein EDB82DRAFT_554888 [Fusarium venenatum]